ncbi:MAG: hypothetical protein COB02_14510 [Candidatus Cloacimonadota bacterium]|nr:MAG: hypothetical protein COB02_14510 [Candidatus Cloacimonadota bacterium]
MRKKFFNVAGPCKKDWHYFVERPIDAKGLMSLIEDGKYFIHHAPRQTGKSSLLIDLCKKINKKGDYTCLYINIEAAQTTRDNVVECNNVIVQEILNNQLNYLSENEQFGQNKEFKSDNYSVQKFLSDWSRHNKKPIVLIIDEIDSLIGDGLLSILRQLRAGYDNRPNAFPHSVLLNGVRDLRDYRIYSKAQDKWLTGGSCFNIKSDSIRLDNFNLEHVKDLFNQHSKEHNQIFEIGVVEEIFRLTDGQPWLCNALGDVLCFKLFKDKGTLTLDDLKIAKEKLILRRDTHIDQLYHKLETEERLRNIVMPMLLGDQIFNAKEEDLQYCKDLGILKNSKQIEIANPIYKEVLPRELSNPVQQGMAIVESDYYKSGNLDLKLMMNDFVDFYREHVTGQLSFFYNEITPHIMIMAYLQRVVNGGGEIHREYALGRRRLDVGVFYKRQKFAIEIKVKRTERSRKESLQQTADYMALLGITEGGWLIIFDQDLSKPWQDRYHQENDVVYGGKKITVIEM